MKKNVTILAMLAVLITGAAVAQAGGHHKGTGQTATQDVCVFGTGLAGEEASVILYGPCDDVQLGVGGRTVQFLVPSTDG